MQKYIIAIVALVVGLTVGHYFWSANNVAVGTSLSCSSGDATCLPAIKLTGSADTSAPSLSVDTGGISITGTSALAAVTATSLSLGGATGLTFVKSGTCSLVSDASIAATSTGTGTCATSGSLAGDRVFIEIATTTTKVAAQYTVAGTVATTDSTTVRLINLTGGAAVPSATNGFGSSTEYSIFR